MENQHREIKGYRELSQAEIDLMNEVKAAGPQLQALCDKIGEHLRSQHANAVAEDAQQEVDRIAAADPARWLQWGREGMQAQLMYLTRAIAQPTFF